MGKADLQLYLFRLHVQFLTAMCARCLPILTPARFAWLVVLKHGKLPGPHNVTISFDDPEEYLLEFASGVLEAKPSMLQDHMARQRSEIDVINGAIPEMAARVGRSAPYNEVVSAIVWAREAEFGLDS